MNRREESQKGLTLIRHRYQEKLLHDLRGALSYSRNIVRWFQKQEDGVSGQTGTRRLEELATHLAVIARCVDELTLRSEEVEGALASNPESSPLVPADVQFVPSGLNKARSPELETLVARSIHELRQSVSGLRNLFRWLTRALKPQPGSKVERKLSDARLEIQTLKLLVESIDLWQEEPIASPQETLIFGDIIMKAGAQIRERLARLGVSPEMQVIRYERVDSIPPLVLPRSYLQHIVLNITNNALKYRDKTEKGFRMEIEGDSDELSYIIHFRDWGIGVPPGWEERVFSIGERAGNATQASFSGRGMGLFIVRCFAQRLGGSIELTSRREPTEFTLRLPKYLAVR